MEIVLAIYKQGKVVNDMYESPVNVIYGEMNMQIEADICKAIQNIGIDVNKEELIKALQYDRGQYEKGYKDGYKSAIDKFAELVIEAFTYIPKKYVMALAEEMKAEMKLERKTDEQNNNH